jgi:hypothetical protein
MKRILNLYTYGTRFLGSAALFGVLGGVAHLAAPLLQRLGMPAEVTSALSWWFLGAAGSLLLALIVLVILEQIQDALVDHAYFRSRHRRLPAGGGFYECQYCGNRQVQETDSYCSVCGRSLL